MRYLYNPLWSLGYLIVNLTVISFVNSCVEEDYKLWYLQVVSIVLVLFHLWKFHSTGGLTMKENCLAVNWFCWWPCAIMVCLKNVFHSIWDSFWCIATKLWCIEIHHFLVFGIGATNLSYAPIGFIFLKIGIDRTSITSSAVWELVEVSVHHSIKFIVQANMHASLGHRSDVTQHKIDWNPM